MAGRPPGLTLFNWPQGVKPCLQFFFSLPAERPIKIGSLFRELSWLLDMDLLIIRLAARTVQFAGHTSLRNSDNCRAAAAFWPAAAAQRCFTAELKIMICQIEILTASKYLHKGISAVNALFGSLTTPMQKH
jgi:hypothetical protein